MGESAQAPVAFVDDQDGVGSRDGRVGVMDADPFTVGKPHDERFEGLGLQPMFQVAYVHDKPATSTVARGGRIFARGPGTIRSLTVAALIVTHEG